MHAELETLAETQDDAAVQTHIHQASKDVAFHAEQPGPGLPEPLRKTLD